MMERIRPLRKQLYDKFSMLPREEWLTLFTGTCIPSSWTFNAMSIHQSILIRLIQCWVRKAADPAGWPRLPSHLQHFPPPGSRVATTTGTDDLPTTAPMGHFYNRGFEHGPLSFHVSNLPRDVWEVHPEVGVEDLLDRVLHQTFPVHPHYTFGLARSFSMTPPPCDPIHH